MAFCPSCRHEFEAFAARCPDCDVELTDALEPSVGGGPGFELMLVLASDAETAAAMREALGPTRIPVGDLGEEAEKLPGDAVGLLLPKEFANTAVRAMDAHPRLVRGQIQLAEDAEPTIFFKLSDGAEVELDRDLLVRPAAEVVARGPETIVPLLEFVRIGDDAARERAIKVLRGFGDTGIHALGRQLAVLARELREAALYGVLREIRERLTDASALDDLVAVAADPSAEAGARTLALHALGRLALPAVHVGIVPLLADDDLMVREEADEALCTLSDEDMGFDPDLEPAAIAEIQAKWTAWFERA